MKVPASCPPHAPPTQLALPRLRTLARLLSRSGRLMSGTVTEGLNSCREGRAVRLRLRAGSRVGVGRHSRPAVRWCPR